MSRKDELKERIGSEKTYEAHNANAKVSVIVDENGIISKITFSSKSSGAIHMWYEASGNPHNEECFVNYENALEEMMNTDLDTFKDLLRRIKDTDTELFNLCNEMLRKRKEHLHKEAEEKYSL